MKRSQQQHVMGRYTDDMLPPGERDPSQVRVRRPGCVLIGGLLLGVLAAAAAAVIALTVLLRPSTSAGQNAVWLGIDWGRDVQTDEAVQRLADLLRAERIGRVYVWMSWLQEDTTWSETTFTSIGTFLQQFRRFYPEARLDAWIGLPAEVPEYRLDDEDVRAEVAAFAERALTEFGFDGIHLNVEPVWDGDESFLQLLRDVRGAIGTDVVLSASVPPDWNTGAPGIPVGPYTTVEAHWSQEYKQRVAFLLDEMVVMAYNSGLSSPGDYQTWMAFQVTQFVSALSVLDIPTVLIIGIPTYDAELPGHDPAVESIPAAIGGVRRGLEQSGEAGSRVKGLGIYAEWSTDAAEWNAYRLLWLNPSGG